MGTGERRAELRVKSHAERRRLNVTGDNVQMMKTRAFQDVIRAMIWKAYCEISRQ